MGYLNGFALSAVLLHAAAASAAPDVCTSLTPVSTKIEVNVEAHGEPAIRAASAEEIQRLGRRAGRSQADEAVTRGLTSSEIQATARYELLEQTLPESGRCTTLSKITAHFAIPTATIWIDRRYRPDSCEYSAVLEHEQEHVRITRETLQRWEDRIRQQLESAVTSWRDRWLPAAVEREIKAAIDHAIADLVRQIQADADRQHAAIDVPAAYEDVGRRCSGW
jgi:predicted Zn-dependent protease